MKNILLLVIFALSLSIGVSAQTATAGPSASSKAAAENKSKRQIFRANKEQIKQAQTLLKSKSLYTGEATGKLDDMTRASLKAYQKDNGIKDTGTLNRITLEKMGIELTDAQKAIPVAESSTEASSTTASAASSDAKPKRVIFRATKDQIISAQTLLKTNKMYDGEATGKLDPDTRAGLKKYQEANGLKVTGTLNQVTLEKMGIELTDNQKQTAAAADKE
jgi:peptidoglycan hydrolase-like protein with peptidoglycan-binding domain